MAQNRPAFIFPVLCTPGQDCWVMNYPDTDPAADRAEDFKCGPRTYDAHTGTDIGLRDVAAMQKGVPVLAAAPGRVERVRDGEPDGTLSEKQVEELKDKECGNGIVLDHGNGLQSLYCHVKKGSLLVKPGDTVTAGQPLAAVGQSGKAEFPHLHFEVIRDGSPADPFTGAQLSEGCGKDKGGLWTGAVIPAYEPVILYDGGFAPAAPDFAAIERGERPDRDRFSSGGVAFAFWIGILGAAEGDTIALDITGPDGKPFVDRTIVQDKTRARQFYFVGRQVHDGNLPPGAYTGTATLTRTSPDGGEPLIRTFTRTARVE